MSPCRAGISIGSGQMGDVALEVPLRLFPFGRLAEGHHPDDTGVQRLGDAFDGAAFAGVVAPFEEDDDLQALLHDIPLQFSQFEVKITQVAEVHLFFEPLLFLPLTLLLGQFLLRHDDRCCGGKASQV